LNSRRIQLKLISPVGDIRRRIALQTKIAEKVVNVEEFPFHLGLESANANQLRNCVGRKDFALWTKIAEKVVYVHLNILLLGILEHADANHSYRHRPHLLQTVLMETNAFWTTIVEKVVNVKRLVGKHMDTANANQSHNRPQLLLKPALKGQNVDPDLLVTVEKMVDV